MQYKKYRLRWNQEIVGYAEETSEGVLYKGKEWLWWMRAKPRYNRIDEFVGYKDRLHREIYELDIVSFHLENKKKPIKAIVVWQVKKEEFALYDYEKERFFPLQIEGLSLFENDKLEIVSHLFTQKELQKKLKWLEE